MIKYSIHLRFYRQNRERNVEMWKKTYYLIKIFIFEIHLFSYSLIMFNINLFNFFIQLWNIDDSIS